MCAPIDSCLADSGSGLARLLGAVCTPANLLLGCALVLGWLALIAWTGAGPGGWQARLCADLDAQPRACAAVQASRTDDRPGIPGAAS
ncbi:hypothetical protein [Methylobacterium dankookense]|uniref:Uncharacterized protein n=1 Tax=Methylobacterium dankookense TaxID=560405 RepID=A0A564FUY1_9HYPH|nr:hypothetical protein [Methylobacterium dankookense]GJD54957.1 hypothetical protein IFDJLNFL_0838 [Methylobacterium dankookense]VUF11955.1 hypothetical protein MTDSW087_01642 [Methylobacterium dankookense]